MDTLLNYVSNPVVVIVTFGFLIVVLGGESFRQSREQRQVDQVLEDVGEEHKDSVSSSRDSRKQGAALIESDIKNSECSRSERSEGLMEERNQNQGIVIIGKPRSVEESQKLLDEAKEALKSAQKQAVWQRRNPSLAIRQLRQAEEEYEARRRVHNQIFIDAHDRNVLNTAMPKSSRQLKITVIPRGAI